MKLLVLIALVCICKALGYCPFREDVDCYLYERVGNLHGEKCDRQNTYFQVGGNTCTGCHMYIGDPAGEGRCPYVPCPYKQDISEILRQDCGVTVYRMRVNVGSRVCDACDIAVYNCTQLPWVGRLV